MPTPAAVRYRKILASRRPEESIRQLADRCGILPQNLYRWSSRLGPHQPEDAPTFFPVHLTALTDTHPEAPTPMVELRLARSGHHLRLPATTDPHTLRTLVDALEAGA